MWQMRTMEDYLHFTKNKYVYHEAAKVSYTSLYEVIYKAANDNLLNMMVTSVDYLWAQNLWIPYSE